VAFHPELTGDDRLHGWLLEQVGEHLRPVGEPA